MEKSNDAALTATSLKMSARTLAIVGTLMVLLSMFNDTEPSKIARYAGSTMIVCSVVALGLYVWTLLGSLREDER